MGITGPAGTGVAGRWAKQVGDTIHSWTQPAYPLPGKPRPAEPASPYSNERYGRNTAAAR